MNALHHSGLITPPLSLYVHYPWCVRKCPYCDFNSHALKGKLPSKDYSHALIRDLASEVARIGQRPIQTVFFGGGTPSLFAPQLIARFLDEASAYVAFVDQAEITLEANPGTTEHGLFQGYRAAGINRLSIGVQSFHDEHLQQLGRIHTSSEAEQAIKNAQDAGLTNLNLDLMYALPGQRLDQAEEDVKRACSLAPSHISYYQLTLEPNTYFYVHKPKGLPDEDQAWDIQTRGQYLLANAGYQQYEVSAYAHERQRCDHNVNYWQFGDYIGIGAGAHGKLTCVSDNRIVRRWKQRHPLAYLQHAGTAQAIGGEETIGVERRPFEFMLNALRLCHGFALDLMTQRTGISPSDIASPLKQALEYGWINMDERGWVSPTVLGQRFTNDMVALFLPD